MLAREGINKNKNLAIQLHHPLLHPGTFAGCFATFQLFTTATR